MAKKKTGRATQTEIPIKGKGVEKTTDTKLIDLSDKRINFNDDKAAAAKGLKETDAEILNRMNILGLKSFRVGDKLFVDDSKHHVKVTTVKGEGPVETDAATETGA